MKVSMDGLRSNLSSDIEKLREVAEAILKDEWFDKEDFEDAMNDVITASNVLNCIYDNDNESFSDMGHVEVERLEVISEDD